MSANVNLDIGEVDRTPFWVLGVCLAAMTLEGYDVVAYGAALPYLLEYEAWALTPGQAGFIGSLTPVGMLFGALAAGVATDVFGRRRLVLFSVTLFSLAMGLCAVAPGPELFGLFRFMVGLGVGGVLPTVAALVFEYSPARRRNLNNAIAFSGFGIGGILAATCAATLAPSFGFRVVFFAAAVPLVLFLPLTYRFLPESISFLLAKGRREDAERVAGRLGLSLSEGLQPPAATGGGREPSVGGGRFGALAYLFSRRYFVATALFCAATFLCLLVVFGLYTWLPVLMREAGYPLGSALTFLMVLNVGTIIGTLFAAVAADRLGSKPVVVACFLVAAASLFLLSYQLPLPATYLLVVLAGLGTLGTQILINVYVASHYPVGVRATALGTVLSLGRFGGIVGPTYGGLMVASGLGVAWNFYAFALPSLVGALVLLLVPRAPEHSLRSGARLAANEPETAHEAQV